MKFRNANPLQIVGVLLGMLLHAFVWSADAVSYTHLTLPTIYSV